MIGAAYLDRDERLENLLWQEADLDVAAIEALTVSNLDSDELARFAQHLADRSLSVVEHAGFDRDRSGTSTRWSSKPPSAGGHRRPLLP